MTLEDLYKQNISDLLTVINVCGDILTVKKLTDQEKARMSYCERVLNNVTEKQNLINAIH